MAALIRSWRCILIALLALVILHYIDPARVLDADSFHPATDLSAGTSDSRKDGVPLPFAAVNGPGEKAPGGSDVHFMPDDIAVDAAASYREKASSALGSPSDTSLSPVSGSMGAQGTASGDRMNATFVTLARNSDVWEISRSIRQVEDRFNRRYNYDWVFLNDGDFDDTFKSVTSALTSGRTRYGKVDGTHWGFPDFIDQNKAAKVREDMQERNIPYSGSVSYRHMCRYESGFFFRHD